MVQVEAKQTGSGAAAGATAVLLALCARQFLMALDSSVMKLAGALQAAGGLLASEGP